MGVRSKVFDAGFTSNGDSEQAKTSKISRMNLTDAEKRKLAELVKAADSIEEVQKIEKDFYEGRLPPGIIAGEVDAMEE